MGAYSHLYKLSKWRAVRRRVLSEHPLCTKCLANKRITLASIVDHITPHAGNMELFWDPNNMQPLCVHCHNSIKQSMERIGFEKDIGKDGWPMHPCHPVNKKISEKNFCGG